MKRNRWWNTFEEVFLESALQWVPVLLRGHVERLALRIGCSLGVLLPPDPSHFRKHSARRRHFQTHRECRRRQRDELSRIGRSPLQLEEDGLLGDFFAERALCTAEPVQ